MSPSAPVVVTKKFDLKELEEALKANGIPAAEAAGKVIADTIFDWAKKSLELEALTNPLYAIAVPVIDAIKAEVDKLLTPA